MVKAEQDFIQFETKHNTITNPPPHPPMGSLSDFPPEQLVIPCSEVRRICLLFIKHFLK